MPLTRRQFVVQASAASALAATGTSLHAGQKVQVSLRDTGRSRGILVGCAVATDKLRNDAAYAELVRSQAGILVAENAFKYAFIHPSPTKYFFEDADYLAKFAADNRIKLRGHNFVWHRSLPQGFDSYITSQNAEKVLTEHIEKVAGHFAGRIHSWDVVNEAVSPKDGLTGGMRNSIWQQVLPGYIDIAFRAARRADPAALLVYNDYGIEAEDLDSSTKRQDVLALLRGMKERDVPIDGLGIQSHISAGLSHVYGTGLMSLIEEASAMDLKIFITEMDANDRSLPADIATRDAAVAAAYSSYLKLALENPAVIALLTWGITDRYTWLNGEGSRKDGLRERPLLFDENLKPKLSFESTLWALQNAPER